METALRLTRQVDGGAKLGFPLESWEELSRLGVWIVIPMYRVKSKIADVIEKIPGWVTGVVAVDDKCPEQSGDFVESFAKQDNLFVLRHEVNQGVGGAVMTGYREAIARGARIIVKVDGDDQMDLAMLAPLLMPIATGQADYTKGNRFSSLSHVKGMPAMRLFGNSVLSLMSKVSSGYWNIFDPTNGYTAIESRVAQELLTRTVARRYFFESDVLYHLGALRAVVRDVAMPAVYADEKSNLSITRVVLPFLAYHVRNAFKRFFGQYVVRDFTVATLETIFGLMLIAGGLVVTARHFLTQTSTADVASPGLVMLAALPIMLGVQLILSAINFDVLNVPKDPIHQALRGLDRYRLLDPGHAPPTKEAAARQSQATTNR
jgi:dolichol-phosphate mannosyltransferase